MLIVDSHTHLGASGVTESNYKEDFVLSNLEKNNVDAAILLPLAHAIPGEVELHDWIHRLGQQYPKKIFGCVELFPGHPEEYYYKEAGRCFEQLGFVAVKLHTYLQPVNPTSAHANKVFEVAKKYKVPVIVHTGAGVPNSMPALVLPRARQYPDVPIVLAHAGASYFFQEAVIVAQLCDNVYLEPTWCNPMQCKTAVTTLGSDRVMFSSDSPPNLEAELVKYRNAGLTDSQLEDVLGKTANTVFKLGL